MSAFTLLAANHASISSSCVVGMSQLVNAPRFSFAAGPDDITLAQLAAVVAERDALTASLDAARAELGDVPSRLQAAALGGRRDGRRSAFKSIQNANVLYNS